MEALQDDRPTMPHLVHEARTVDFWNSLGPEQVHYLRTMLLSIMTSESDAGHASYQLGAADMVLRMKFGLCPRCGQSHDANSSDQREVFFAGQDYLTVCEQYNVIPKDDDGNDFTIGRVQCKLCGSIWQSLMDRINAAPVGSFDCPTGSCSRAAAIK
jgi:hypothetical protein